MNFKKRAVGAMITMFINYKGDLIKICMLKCMYVKITNGKFVIDRKPVF